MNIALWIATGLLALAFLASGLMKLGQPKQKLAAAGMGWVEDFTPGPIKAIGLAEVLGAMGLILPGITGIAPVLVALAATGLLVLMIGATVTHVRRGEKSIVNVVLIALALFVAVGRFAGWDI